MYIYTYTVCIQFAHVFKMFDFNRASPNVRLNLIRIYLNTFNASSPFKRYLFLYFYSLQIYSVAGPVGFFKGLGARVLYSMPATAICWSTYEFFKFALSSKNNDHYRSSVSGSRNPPLEKVHNSTSDKYVIPKPPVIATEIIITESNHSSPPELNLTGSQYIPVTSRELPLGVYTAINMKPMHADRVYDPSIRGCSR